MNAFMPINPPSSPFGAAIQKLRAAGYTCDPADIPGLTIVSGPNVLSHEMTMGQVVAFAASLP